MSFVVQGNSFTGSGICMRNTVSKPWRRFEAEVIREGINYNDSIYFYYVEIRRGDNILCIVIPKTHPQDYTIEEKVLGKWVPKLWL